MKKIGFIFDSFVCMTKDEAEKMGYGYIPLITEIDNHSYLDGVEVNRRELLEKIAKSKNIKTSLPYLAWFEQVFKQMCSKFDEVIYLPISSKLSSTSSAAANFVNEFKNLHIIENAFVADQYLEVAQYGVKHFQKHQDINKLIEKINEIKQKTLTFIFPKNIDYLVKGGRVSSFKKFMLGAMSIVKLSPYVKFDLQGTAMGGIGRGPKGVIKQIIAKFEEFTGLSTNALVQEYKIFSVTGIDDEFNLFALDLFKKKGIEFVNKKFNSSVIAVHTGPEAQAFTLMPNLDKFEI
ncbi:DegV family EDD domain-containing protein [Mycoplasmopsis phocirhinis]|uniref:DegV family EDD domain-containing protein n=1 Tax=Mycoplasmopsis phocirhinis TaxID=142650 RepID=A0A4P6MRN4_9BACT|nr:DegV family protein [Mycoplasmopsis phocirhinis]QBF34491.1 DegV family EDD domain-containing protein [Mycoplasmopsis phocirhinis]